MRRLCGRGRRYGGDRKHDAEDRKARSHAQSVPAQAEIGGQAEDAEAPRGALRTPIGDDEAMFANPIGVRVNVNQSIVDHILKDAAKRHDGREAYFLFIPETTENPAEIWVGFARSEVTGRVWVRRRYAKVVSTPKGRTVGMIVDLDEGRWASITFFRGRLNGLKNLRTGLQIYVDK